MLNFSLEFHTNFWAFDKQKFLMLASLDRRRSVRCLRFPFEKTTFELNFSAMETACFSAMHMHLTRCAIRARLETSPSRESI